MANLIQAKKTLQKKLESYRWFISIHITLNLDEEKCLLVKIDQQTPTKEVTKVPKEYLGYEVYIKKVKKMKRLF